MTNHVTPGQLRICYINHGLHHIPQCRVNNLLIIILSLYSLLTRPDSKKDEISPRQVQTGNIINLDNKFSNFDPDRVVATFLEAMNQGNLDLSKGFISELASKNNIDKLYVGEESILNKNVSYEIVN